VIFLSALLALAAVLAPAPSGSVSYNWAGYVQPGGVFTSVAWD
jgi:hypothetical protein